MNTPLISVCMAAYNVAPYIAAAIESVMAQTYTNWELIIVDDGSTDKTREIAFGYTHDARIRVFTQANKGQCNASNEAYRRSSGSFIKFLDADDLMHPFYFEAMIRKMDGSKYMLFSHCVNFYDSIDNGKPYYIEAWEKMRPVDFLVNKASTMRQGGRWLIPREIIENGGLWNESLSLINDYEYFTRLCLASSGIIYVKDAVLYYRQVSNSLSSQKSYKAFLSAFNSINLACNHLQDVEDSKRVRLCIANDFQDILFRMYPNHQELIGKIEERIESLGGSKIKMGGGKTTLLLNKIIGWKTTVLLKRTIKQKLTYRKQSLLN